MDGGHAFLHGDSAGKKDKQEGRPISNVERSRTRGLRLVEGMSFVSEERTRKGLDEASLNESEPYVILRSLDRSGAAAQCRNGVIKCSFGNLENTEHGTFLAQPNSRTSFEKDIANRK